uniref:ABC transporter permease subunit n=1 Tax=Acinetobacter baumannii TaxID=470 RepID=UPI0013D338E6
FRNIPFLVQLFWFFYAIPVLTGIQARPFVAAWVALSLYGGAYFGEIYRAGIQSVERGQWEGARAIGLGHLAVMR